MVELIDLWFDLKQSDFIRGSVKEKLWRIDIVAHLAVPLSGYPHIKLLKDAL